MTDLRTFVPQQGALRGTLSGADAVSSSTAEGALERYTLRARGAARAAQGWAGVNSTTARFNTPARTRAEAWGGGAVSTSGGGNRNMSRQRKQHLHEGHRGVFTRGGDDRACRTGGGGGEWGGGGGGAPLAKAGGVLPGRSARAGSAAAARRKAVFGEGNRPPAHTVAAERKAEVAGGLRQEAALLANQMRALQRPRGY